ncbi:MAG: class I SAM-dependent methyltransferase [Gemmataceae bacterium]
MSRRRFDWTSSTVGDLERVRQLDATMSAFYSRPDTRERYQAMLDSPECQQPQTEAALARAVVARTPQRVIEVGCGRGRMYQALRAAGFVGAYTGLEMSAEVIERNRQVYPDQTWEYGSVYAAPFADGAADAVFAFFVLEHCVYPELALTEMLRWVRPGGAVLLTFPDFVEMGMFGSQTIGLRVGNAKALLRRGRLLSACVGLYDSRVRLPAALRSAVARYGPFPVNLSPWCVRETGPLGPDMDAVYIASKSEVKSWAERRGLTVRFPEGVDNHYRVNALIELAKGDG